MACTARILNKTKTAIIYNWNELLVSPKMPLFNMMQVFGQHQPEL